MPILEFEVDGSLITPNYKATKIIVSWLSRSKPVLRQTSFRFLQRPPRPDKKRRFCIDRLERDSLKCEAWAANWTKFE